MSGGRFFIIEIDTWWLEKAREQVAIIDSSADFSGGDLTLFALNLYKEFLETDDVSPLIVEGLMLALIGKISRSARATLGAHAPRWLEHAPQPLRFAASLLELGRYSLLDARRWSIDARGDDALVLPGATSLGARMARLRLQAISGALVFSIGLVFITASAYASIATG